MDLNRWAGKDESLSWMRAIGTYSALSHSLCTKNPLEVHAHITDGEIFVRSHSW